MDKLHRKNGFELRKKKISGFSGKKRHSYNTYVSELGNNNNEDNVILYMKEKAHVEKQNVCKITNRHYTGQPKKKKLSATTQRREKKEGNGSHEK